ncbi:MAG: winged helix-turn-helix domain-containing protein [Anaerolineaceae bacterium]
MSPVIRISDATFTRLQQWATPLTDTVDDALNKVLDAAADGTSRLPDAVAPVAYRPKVEAKESMKTIKAHPDETYYPLILEALHQLGGSGTKSQVTKRIGSILEGELTPDDRTMVSSGEERWENRVAWARNFLKEQGLIQSGSQRGVWELTGLGHDLARSRNWPKSWRAKQ